MQVLSDEGEFQQKEVPVFEFPRRSPVITPSSNLKDASREEQRRQPNFT